MYVCMYIYIYYVICIKQLVAITSLLYVCVYEHVHASSALFFHGKWPRCHLRSYSCCTYTYIPTLKERLKTCPNSREKGHVIPLLRVVSAHHLLFA